jgi:hypothetical protein
MHCPWTLVSACVDNLPASENSPRVPVYVTTLQQNSQPHQAEAIGAPKIIVRNEASIELIGSVIPPLQCAFLLHIGRCPARLYRRALSQSFWKPQAQ